MLSTFHGEDALMAEPVRRLWSPIFNADVGSTNKPERDLGMARYSSTNGFLTPYMENDESRVEFARSRAALDMSVLLNGAKMVSDISANEELYLPLTGG